MFADQDRNFDGLVDQTQLVAMVKHLLDSTSAELLFDLDWNPDDSYDAAFLFNSLDTNGDGKVSFQEVVAWWRANILDAEKKTKTNKEFDPNETFHESLLVGTRGPFAALAGRKAELAKEAPAAGRTSGAYFTTSVLENSTKVISGIVGASFAIESVAHLAIFVTFLANTIFFAFADLTKFGNAVSHLSLLSQTGGDVSSSSPISVISVPVFSTAKRAGT